MQKWSKVAQNPVTLQQEAGVLFFVGVVRSSGLQFLLCPQPLILLAAGNPKPVNGYNSVDVPKTLNSQ